MSISQGDAEEPPHAFRTQWISSVPEHETKIVSKIACQTSLALAIKERVQTIESHFPCFFRSVRQALNRYSNDRES